MENVAVRVARPEDAGVLANIYAPYVEKTAVSFEYVPPDATEFRSRIENTLHRYPYLVAECGGEVAGYAYAGPFHTRSAYGYSAETTLYVREDLRGLGVGRALYRALEGILQAQNVTNLYACIGYPATEDEFLTKASARFHVHMGYALIGEFHHCGYKFNRWYGIVWMEKMLRAHVQTPPEVIPFPKLRPEVLDALGIGH